MRGTIQTFGGGGSHSLLPALSPKAGAHSVSALSRRKAFHSADELMGDTGFLVRYGPLIRGKWSALTAPTHGVDGYLLVDTGARPGAAIARVCVDHLGLEPTGSIDSVGAHLDLRTNLYTVHLSLSLAGGLTRR